MPNLLSRSASADAEAPITEPLIVPDLCVDEVEIRAGRHSVKLIGLSMSPGIAGDPGERRIVTRLSLPIDVARAMWGDLAAALREDERDGEARFAFAQSKSRDKMLDN